MRDWLIKLLRDLRKPQIRVVSVGQVIFINGRAYKVMQTHLQLMPIRNIAKGDTVNG